MESFVREKSQEWDAIIKGKDKQKARVAYLEQSYTREILKQTQDGGQ